MRKYSTTIADVNTEMGFTTYDDQYTAKTGARAVLKLLGFTLDAKSSTEETEVWSKGKKTIVLINGIEDDGGDE